MGSSTRTVSFTTHESQDFARGRNDFWVLSSRFTAQSEFGLKFREQ
jgi:hypothetical protein